MPAPEVQKQAQDATPVLNANRMSISEDWLAVVIAFLLIVLSAIGLLGPHGIRIVF